MPSLLVDLALMQTTASSSVSPSLLSFSPRLCADTTVSMELPALVRERVRESLDEEAALVGRLTTRSAR